MTEQFVPLNAGEAVIAAVNSLNARSLPCTTQDVVKAMVDFGHHWANVDSTEPIFRETPFLVKVASGGWVVDTLVKNDAGVVQGWLKTMHAVHVGISEEWLLHSLPEVPQGGGYSTTGRRGLLLSPQFLKTEQGEYVPARRRSLPILVRSEELLDDAPFFPHDLDANERVTAAMNSVRAHTKSNEFYLQRIQFEIGTLPAHLTLLATSFRHQRGLLAWTSPIAPTGFNNFQEQGWWMWDSDSPQPLSEPWTLLPEPNANNEALYRGLVFSTDVAAVLELAERTMRLYASRYSNVEIDTSHWEKRQDPDRRRQRLDVLVQRQRGPNKNLPKVKCHFCTRNLSDDLSVARGYGPECKKKHVDTDRLDRSRITQAEVDSAVKSMGAHAPWESYATIEDAYRRIAQD